jgi:hypothetical protein
MQKSFLFGPSQLAIWTLNGLQKARFEILLAHAVGTSIKNQEGERNNLQKKKQIMHQTGLNETIHILEILNE